MRTLFRLSIVLLLLFAGCSGGELVGVHIDLAADGSGTLTLRSLAPSETATAAETRTHGANWTVRGALVSSRGTFERIAQLTLGDGEVTFAPQLDGDRPGLRVTLTRGPTARWIASLAPEREQRRQLARAYDPTGRTREIGDVIRLEIEAPGRVITSGVLPTGRGVEADRDGDKAVLLLPVATAQEEGDAFTWDISWLRK